MHPASAGDLVENPASSNGLRLGHKPVDRLLHVCGASPVSFSVQAPVVGVMLTPVRLETGRPLDHEPRQVGRMGDASGGHGHDVFQTPGRFGVTDVARELEAPAVVVPPRVVGELQVTAEPDDRGRGWRVPMRLDEDDHVPRWCERLVPQWGLVDAGLEVMLHGRGVERRLRHAAVIQLTAILARWANPGIRAFVGHGPRRV